MVNTHWHTEYWLIGFLSVWFSELFWALHWCSDYQVCEIKIIWQIVFICSIKSQCTDKNISIAIFDAPKTWNVTSGGVQNRETKNRRLGMIVTSFPDEVSGKSDFSDIFFNILL